MRRLFSRTGCFGIILFTMCVQSCDTQKKMGELIYFNQKGDSALARTIQDYEPLIQPGDRLSIIINALNPASVAPYNLGFSGGALTSGAGAGGYVVETDGTIQFPQLGKIAVVGLKRRQLIDKLTPLLEKFVTDPVLSVEFLNFKITVLGEVNRPGTINIPDGKVTLIEAIGLAGDLTFTARRDNIIVIREKNGVREFGQVSLLSKNAFTSPYFVLKQNDVVYVELTKAKVLANDQSITRNVGITASIISLISTLVFLTITLTR